MRKHFPCLHVLHAVSKLSVCLALLLPLAAEAAQAGKKGQLVLVAANSMPTAYFDNGQLTGVLVDVISEAFLRAGYTVTIKLEPWARCIEDARQGEVDGIFSIFKTPERQAFLDYTSQPIITQTVSFFVLKNAPIRFDGNFASISHQSIAFINQTSYGPRLDEALKKNVFAKQHHANSAESVVRMLMAGRVEVIPSYRHVVLFTAKSLGAQDQIRELSPEVESIPSYLAFNRKRDYRQVMADYDKALKSMQQDGSYDRIFDRYLR
ncbi:ABC transporter substrate-binding protein [Uliginosibacterium flavum]|uniref:Transporter substrate-binding domain-containing protein n=1 Tax=Uliginosibacterium flavum TaxID=1396831 RepID=A0ABV2TPU5_9RHOO